MLMKRYLNYLYIAGLLLIGTQTIITHTKPVATRKKTIQRNTPKPMSAYQSLLPGYKAFRKKYAAGDESITSQLADYGQKPKFMVVGCSDSRVDPGVIFQTAPGVFFTVRNVANIVPPYVSKQYTNNGCEGCPCYYSEYAALQYAVQSVGVEHIFIIGHSACGGCEYCRNAVLNGYKGKQGDLILPWVNLIRMDNISKSISVDDYAKAALHISYNNCLDYPWIKEAVDKGDIDIHRWFYDIRSGQMLVYCTKEKDFFPLDSQQGIQEEFVTKD